MLFFCFRLSESLGRLFTHLLELSHVIEDVVISSLWLSEISWISLSVVWIMSCNSSLLPFNILNSHVFYLFIIFIFCIIWNILFCDSSCPVASPFNDVLFSFPLILNSYVFYFFQLDLVCVMTFLSFVGETVAVSMTFCSPLAAMSVALISWIADFVYIGVHSSYFCIITHLLFFNCTNV